MPTPSHAQSTYVRRKAALRRLVGTALLALVVALPQAASAQRLSPEERIERRVEALADALDLSDAQALEVRAILEADLADRPPRGARGSGDRAARREQMEARRAETDAQIEAVLTEAQVEAYRAWRDENAGRRGPRGRRGDGA